LLTTFGLNSLFTVSQLGEGQRHAAEPSIPHGGRPPSPLQC